MSDTTPETPTEPASNDAAASSPTEHEEALIVPQEPAPAEPVVSEPVPASSAVNAEQATAEEPSSPAEPVDAQSPAEPAEEPLPQEPVAPAEPTEAPVTSAEPAEAPAPAPAAEQPVAPGGAAQPVYVHAPVPPVRRGNRAVGSLISLGAAVIFAALFAGIVLAIAPLFAPPNAVGFEFLRFLVGPAFYVPVLVFAAGLILLVVIVNRAGWWAYILGSIFVALFVYFVSIGILLLVNGVIGLTPAAATEQFTESLRSPITIAAALVAREVALWMGAAIAARGRRVKARNREAQANYDRDTARARADYDRAVASNAAQ